MIGNFETSHSQREIKSPENVEQHYENQDKVHVPSMDELRSKVKELFPIPPEGQAEKIPCGQKEHDPFAKENPRIITLEDGTKVELPSGTVVKHSAFSPVESNKVSNRESEKADIVCDSHREMNETNEAENKYYSTYDERLKQTPAEETERGEWDGERGESKFTPTDEKVKEILAKYGLDGIEYNDAIPDFSECSESTVEIDDMSEIRSKNFKQCDEKCAEQWNQEARDGRTDWTAREVKEWREENGYTWHERNDMKTCDLVPTEVNDYFGHLGGVSECKKRDANDDGGGFDE